MSTAGAVRGRGAVVRYVFCLAKPRDVGREWGCSTCAMVTVAVCRSKVEPASCGIE
jgi:hypothetical protein